MQPNRNKITTSVKKTVFNMFCSILTVNSFKSDFRYAWFCPINRINTYGIVLTLAPLINVQYTLIESDKSCLKSKKKEN